MKQIVAPWRVDLRYALEPVCRVRNYRSVSGFGKVEE